MTIYRQVSVTPLLNCVAIGFEVPLVLAEVTVIGLSFNPNLKKKINVAKYVLLLLLGK